MIDKDSLTSICSVIPDYELDTLPDGKFPAKRSGYRVEWKIDNTLYMAKTKYGVRGINVKCDIIHKDGDWYIDE